MSQNFLQVYSRDLTFEIKISKKAPEESRIRKLERWPRETGLSLSLEESGINFNQLIKQYVADYGLELGDKNWSTKRENNKILVDYEQKFIKQGNVVGVAKMHVEIPLNEFREEDNSLVYTAKIYYSIELSEDILKESRLEGTVEFFGL